MCETLESRRLLSGVFVSRPDNFDAGLGANVLAGHVAIGNINGDGNLDIAVTSDGGTSFDFLLGNGNGNFQPASTVYNAGDDPGPPVIADMNNDLASDIVLSNTTQNNISILFNDGDNHFSNRQTIVVGTGPGALAVGDFNDDQNLDIAVLNEGDRVSVLLGNGNGTFQPQGNFDVGSDPDSIALADVNKDGKLDIVTANAGDDTISVLLGDGGGGFSDQKVFDTGAAPTSIAVADFNNDNKLDVAVTDSQSDSVNVLLGNGKGAFNPPSTFVVLPEPQQLVAADFNGDGKQDIATLSRFTPQVSVLLGKGNGSFLAASNFIANPGAGFSMTVGNLEGGNRAVLVTANEILGTVSEMFTSAPSTAPTLLSPADGAKSAASPQLVWSSSDEFPSRVIVAANKADLPTDPSSTAAISSAIIDTTTGSTSITIPAKLVQGNTKYFWEVQFEKG
ncbi:MAG TPA: VCBS repeat-containing protein, partial [Tepidisphaeraceae bacterium]